MSAVMGGRTRTASPLNRPCSTPTRTPSGRRGRRFKSCHPDWSRCRTLLGALEPGVQCLSKTLLSRISTPCKRFCVGPAVRDGRLRVDCQPSNLTATTPYPQPPSDPPVDFGFVHRTVFVFRYRNQGVEAVDWDRTTAPRLADRIAATPCRLTRPTAN